MVAILQVFYSVFSGLLLSLAIPNEIYLLGCPVITFFALIPYYIAIKNSKNYKIAFLNGFFQAFTTHLCSSFWLAFFKDYAAITLGASAIGTGFIGAALGLLLYLPYAGSKSKNHLNSYSFEQKFFNTPAFRILYFASVYTIYEWVKSNGFLGYPWGTIAGTIFTWPVMMQISDITGIYGIGFFFAFANGLFSETAIYYFDSNKKLNRNTQISIIHSDTLFLALFISIFTYGLYQYNVTRTPEKYITTIIVQQNSDPWKQSTDTDSILASQELTQQEINKLDRIDKKPDLVLWSEGTLKYTFPNNLFYYQSNPIENPVTQFIDQINTPLITGGAWVRKTADSKYYYNAALVFDENGNLRGHYSKNHLVPCAEAIPGAKIPFVRKFMEKVIHISAGWTPGDQYVLFDIPCSYNENRILPAVAEINLSKTYSEQLSEEAIRPTVKITTPICFDDCFPDIMRPLYLSGSEVFMNLTDDSWSLTNSSEYQHFVNASYSAIQYRTTLVRSTNAGYSVVLDPSGKILADLPLYEQTSMSYDVPVFTRQMTIYARFGNWFPYLLIILTAIYCIFTYKTFSPSDYIKSERKIKLKNKKKHHHKRNNKK